MVTRLFAASCVLTMWIIFLVESCHHFFGTPCILFIIKRLKLPEAVTCYLIVVFNFRRATNILSHFSQNPEENRNNTSKKKSLMKALKMSIIHVAVFVLSWTPYSMMATWDTVDKEGAAKVPGAVQVTLVHRVSQKTFSKQFQQNSQRFQGFQALYR